MTLTEFLLARITEEEALVDRVGYPFARVLAECEARRLIVGNHERHSAGQSGYGASRYAVLALAAVYADHPDYREEWQA